MNSKFTNSNVAFDSHSLAYLGFIKNISKADTNKMKTIKQKTMKTNSFIRPNFLFRLVMVFIMMLAFGQVWGQSVGDYRTRADGNWSTLNTWQRWNGGSWAIPNSGEGYPGENASPTLVTILNGHNVTLNVSPLSIGALTIANGNTISDITFSGSNELTVNNVTTITSSSNNDYKRIFVNAGKFDTGSLSFCNMRTAVLNS
jgi:hypothetical protein